MSLTELSKEPTVDPAEFNAFFPSPYSLAEFTSPRVEITGASYPARYEGDGKILMIAADERYLPTDTGRLFSTGNHPVETLLPMYHLRRAGFEFDVATVSGRSAKFEFWAMPREQSEITGLHGDYLPRFLAPKKLSDVADGLDASSDYVAVFIPGGHGALIGLPESEAVARVLGWAMAQDRHVISICHGPAALVAAGAFGKPSPFEGYSITAFPDAVDRRTPEIGYMPGGLTWFFGEHLAAQGVTILNSDVTGATHQDRKLLTGDSPFASNALGRLAARALLGEVGIGA
ncbi:MAG: protein deglycase HchA [Rhodovulum sulfidophilum]|uniref:Protein deglycase HchA n=1 Tax=Rhodovulum sulfidophilum TaxID=35806 RepID=A0A2W5N6R9_RHOSU|nr:MAG: protein deglycase HchA [Rhodovulum sulfidophilum]